MAEFDFTLYARKRMSQREVSEVAVFHVVEDADRIIHRQDGRSEYFGEWQGRALLVVAIGDIEEDHEILVLNVIEDVRRRR